jgi:hypothetical protein
MDTSEAVSERNRQKHLVPSPDCRVCVRLGGIAAASLLCVLLVWALRSSVLAQGSGVASGWVLRADGGPAVGAVVRQKTTANHTTAAVDGSFALGGLVEGEAVTITAWLEGYYVAWQVVTPTVEAVALTLRPYPTSDNPDYEWLSSTDPEEGLACMHCMVAFPEWQAGAHGQSAKNPRFFSMYNGTDLAATATISPGFKLDFPGTAGNCATCHAPGAASRPLGAFLADMNELRTGAEQEGVFCEFCHKIDDVYLNPATGVPYPNAPGVLSYRLVRTFPGEVLFLGPLDDVTRRVSYSPLEKKSQFCAPCHQFSFWGTPIYQSFQEWLESPYPAQGIECQTCHMPPETVPYFVYPEQGGLIRDPSTLASHLDLGVKDASFMQQTMAMTLTAQVIGGQVRAVVTLTNVFGGHHVPTDYPGRNLILVIAATDATGRSLQQVSGPLVPEWGGSGDAENDLAGRPGRGYAKILRDAVSGESPVVNYWRPTTISSDNRIPAAGSDISRYHFALPNSETEGPLRLSATLWFRRLFIAQAREKGWEGPDLLMAQQEILVTLDTTSHGIYLPAILAF